MDRRRFFFLLRRAHFFSAKKNFFYGVKVFFCAKERRGFLERRGVFICLFVCEGDEFFFLRRGEVFFFA